MLLTTKSFILPAYGGLFWVHSEITYTPEFNFNITNGKKPNQVYIPGTKNIRNILFVRTRISRVVIVIILWIVYRIMRKRIKHPREEKENKTPL
jgi:flagellar biosynthesis/type III secretory pathway M-ring protein FliF/YscJ